MTRRLLPIVAAVSAAVTVFAAVTVLAAAPSAAAGPVARVLVVGDSISTGCAPDYPGGPTFPCTIPPQTVWPQVAADLWSTQTPSAMQVIASNGARSATFDGDPAVLEAARGATHAVVELGTIDFNVATHPAIYGAHLLDIVNELHAANPRLRVTLLHVNAPLIRPASPIPAGSFPTWQDYGNAARLAASLGGAAFLDVHAQFPQTWAADDGSLVQADLVHPTVAGQARLARAVVSGLPLS